MSFTNFQIRFYIKIIELTSNSIRYSKTIDKTPLLFHFMHSMLLRYPLQIKLYLEWFGTSLTCMLGLRFREDPSDICHLAAFSQGRLKAARWQGSSINNRKAQIQNLMNCIIFNAFFDDSYFYFTRVIHGHQNLIATSESPRLIAVLSKSITMRISKDLIRSYGLHVMISEAQLWRMNTNLQLWKRFNQIQEVFSQYTKLNLKNLASTFSPFFKNNIHGITWP